MEFKVETKSQINNSIYENYGEKWYTAYDDPVALLRAENRAKFPWILNKLRTFCDHKVAILDVGCGGGFLSNLLARQGYKVTGVDLSPESLKVARDHDHTRSVKYELADAYHLPYPDESFDAVTAMDFLEHVERPQDVINEFARVLRPQGLFFFHTFNRNPLSHLVVIKLLEWFIKNTPKNMHVIDLFIKPQELENYCDRAGMSILKMVGIRPKFSTIDWKMIRTGVVSKKMEFTLTKETILSYMGVAQKQDFKTAMPSLIT
jgi:2-polyprenyl-6-hydroxyphenyl methylase / 3-demethylubiquinone-9 3-methyltransferase